MGWPLMTMFGHVVRWLCRRPVWAGRCYDPGDRNVDNRFLIIDSRATSKKKVRPVRHCMHICEVVYKEILKRLTVQNSFQEQCIVVGCYGAV